MVQTGDGSLIIETLQLEGGKLTDVQSFLRGHKEFLGYVLK